MAPTDNGRTSGGTRQLAVCTCIAASFVLFFCGLQDATGQLARQSGEIPMFMGRQVTLATPGADSDGSFGKGPASVCIEGPPKRQCHTAPEAYGVNPLVAVVQIDKNTPALFFSAEARGASGSSIHYALLHPGSGKDLEDFFLADISLSNQSEHAFWSDPAISDARIFVTADYVWGSDESHYEPHRYMISAYLRKPSALLGGLYYDLEDRYMTVHKYNAEATPDILKSEKPEILSRLRKVTSEAKLNR